MFSYNTVGITHHCGIIYKLIVGVLRPEDKSIDNLATIRSSHRSVSSCDFWRCNFYLCINWDGL